MLVEVWVCSYDIVLPILVDNGHIVNLDELVMCYLLNWKFRNFNQSDERVTSCVNGRVTLEFKGRLRIRVIAVLSLVRKL